jgi:hypothetical protein
VTSMHSIRTRFGTVKWWRHENVYFVASQISGIKFVGWKYPHSKPCFARRHLRLALAFNTSTQRQQAFHRRQLNQLGQESRSRSTSPSHFNLNHSSLFVSIATVVLHFRNVSTSSQIHVGCWSQLGTLINPLLILGPDAMCINCI